jgi:hypothetical protein
MNTNQSYLATLLKLITTHFDLEELRSLCLALGVDYDTLRGEGKEGKARELVLFVARQQRLDDLLNVVRCERLNISWPPPPEHFELVKELEIIDINQQHVVTGIGIIAAIAIVVAFTIVAIIIFIIGNAPSPKRNHLGVYWDSSYAQLFLVDLIKPSQETSAKKTSKLNATIRFENTSDCILKHVKVYSLYRFMSNTGGDQIDPYALRADRKVEVKARTEAFLKPGESITVDVMSDIRSIINDEQNLSILFFPDPNNSYSTTYLPDQSSFQDLDQYFVSPSPQNAVSFIDGIGQYKFTGVTGYYMKWAVSYLCEPYDYSHLYEGGLMYPVTLEREDQGEEIYSVNTFIVYDYATKAPLSKVKAAKEQNWTPFRLEEELKTNYHFDLLGGSDSIRTVILTPGKEDPKTPMEDMVGVTLHLPTSILK